MKCRICGCTEDHACPTGCGWAAAPGSRRVQDLCTRCFEFMVHLVSYVEESNRVSKASLARMLDEVYPAGKPVSRRAAGAR